MAKYICPQCSKAFIYCKGCALTPDLYKEQGFCSKECYRASKNVVEEIVIEEPIVEDNNESSIEEIQPIEIEAEADAEAPVVVEPTIKKETYNTYKKKKNKYK